MSKGQKTAQRPTIHDVDPWISTSGGEIPDDALEAGKESDGRPLYIARVSHKGGVHPGKAGEHMRGGAHFGFGGQEVTSRDYEVLMNVRGLDWQKGSGGHVPDNAVVVGEESDGTPLYVARAWHGGGLHVGKIKDGWKHCSIAYGGEEVAVTTYEVLVADD